MSLSQHLYRCEDGELGWLRRNDSKKIRYKWTAPQKLDKKSNAWGAFCMKLTYEDKLEIYKLRKQGVSWPQLGQTYDLNPRNLRYMVKLMDRYGVENVKKKQK